MSESVTWNERLAALDQMLAHLHAEFAAADNETVQHTLHALVGCLRAFADSQFRFLNDGLDSGKLLPSVKYPKEYVLQATLGQVSHDMTVLQRAAEHRLTGIDVMKTTLAKADELAQDALNLAVAAGMLPPSTVVTYFNKAANIRVIPYAPVALVGVPFTATAVPQDYLAIAHEVGHHVYRNTPGLAQKLWKQMPLEPAWQRPWLEEIFADVYGALVAGPVLGLDFQDLMMDDKLVDFVGDDGEHPVEAIRPYLYIAVLQELGFADAAKALEARWQECLKQRGTPTSFLPDGETKPVSLKSAATDLAATGKLILENLAAARQVRNQHPDGYWSQNLTADAPAATLYEKFAEWLESNPVVTVPTLQEFGEEVGIVVGSDDPVNKRRIGDTNTWLDGLKTLTGHPLPDHAWVPVFVANYWNTEGPDDDPPPGDPT